MRNLFLALGISVCVTSAAVAQDLNWKLNNNFAASRLETKMLEDYAAEITKASNGKLTVTVHSGGALGLKDSDAIRWLSAGAADMGLVISSYLGRDAPHLNAAYIQGVVQTQEDHLAALPALKNIYAEFLKEWDIVPLAYIRAPIWKMSIFCRGEPVNTLEELKTKKLRVFTTDLVDTFAELGVSGQIVPQAEMYVALQTGVVDCTVYGNRLAKTLSLQEVAPHASYLYPSASMPFVVAVSKSKWEALTPELQEIVMKAGEHLEQQSTAHEWDPAAETAAVEELKQLGANFASDFPPEDREAFTAAARATWEESAERAGPQAIEWRAQISKELGDDN